MITEEYRALNVALHASRADYGAGGRKWADAVKRFAADRDCATVLDYGCGKGSLKKAMYPQEIAEYDPAIAGKDARPEPADLVVCTDVLEHIEPDQLDAVLDDIRTLANKAVFLLISCRPSVKKLADGRPAHLIVERPEWWRPRLERYFRIHEWMPVAGEVLATALPYKEVDTTKIKAAAGDDVRIANIKANVAKVAKRFEPQRAHDRKLVILCYGPSLANSWLEVLKAKWGGCDIVTVSGAHDFAIERGVVPDFHLESDPREHKVRHIGKPQAGTKYMLASCVHPALVDHLAGYDVTLWHAMEGECAMIPELAGEVVTDGGGSAGLRAMNLFYSLGYRHIEIHGMDCSFAREGEQHAGPHAGKTQHAIKIKAGGREFLTSIVLAMYANQFFQHVRRFQDAKWYLHGDGLLQHMALTQSLTGDKAA